MPNATGVTRKVICLWFACIKQKPRGNNLCQKLNHTRTEFQLHLFASEDTDSEKDALHHIGTVSKKRNKLPPMQVQLQRDECVEVDTGASVSIMPETTLQSLWPGRRLDCTEVRLQSYSKETIPVAGSSY